MLLSQSSALSVSMGADCADQAGIVEHDVEPAVFADGTVNELFDVRFVRHVGMLKHRTSARSGNFADHLLATLRIQIRYHYSGALPGEA